MRRFREWITEQRGQTLVEFALVAPLIILFLVVIVDFGIALDRRIVLQHAVREGGRYAAVTDDISVVCDRTVAQAQDLIGPEDIEISYEDIDGNADPTDAGDSVRVTAHFTYEPSIVGPVLGGLFGGSVLAIDMSPSASSRLEQAVPGDTACP